MKKFAFFLVIFAVISAVYYNRRAEKIETNNESEIGVAETTEEDLEKGREEIMEQRAMSESTYSEETSSEETSSESSSYDNDSYQEKVSNWYCSWCCKIIQKSEEPYGGRCRGSYKNTTYAGVTQRESNTSTHSWYKLSTVGNRKFECSKCQVTVDSEDEPDHGMCDGGDKLEWHSWREL